MNANAIAIGTPSGDRYIRAASNFAFGDVNCFARIPPVLAGDRRKILGLATARETVGSAAVIPFFCVSRPEHQHRQECLCHTILPFLATVGAGESGVAQTLLSVP